ncbi:MAG: hypothetical protein HYT87_18090 [Nitrospirae bacterium]|nr:hypothetical protein [Nitrospirota bacterium]
MWAQIIVILVLGAQGGPTHNFESAASCAKCHSSIHAEWRNTMHAQSYSEPIFQMVFHQVASEADRRSCLVCHAPLAQRTGDFTLDDPITREGVTCDVCHTVSNLPEVGSPGSLVLSPGKTKRGPFAAEELTEKGHKNEYSPAHLKSEFCGACHEVVNKHGFHVMSTFTEWAEGPYPHSGTQCQNCHMPDDVRFPIVDSDVVASIKTATSHGFMGGHSLIQVEKAAEIALVAEKTKKSIEAIVYVTNKESGHKLPTGIPTRQLVLTVRLLDEDRRRVLEEKTADFRRVVADATGREIDADDPAGMLLNATQVLRDNRPSPKETVRESFSFKAPEPPRTLHVEAVLEYHLKPDVPGRGPTHIEMARAQFPLEVEAGGSLLKSAWIPLAVLGAAWALVYLFRRAGGASRAGSD